MITIKVRNAFFFEFQIVMSLYDKVEKSAKFNNMIGPVVQTKAFKVLSELKKFLSRGSPYLFEVAPLEL